MTFADLFELFFFFVNFRITKHHLSRLFNANQCIGSNKLRFKVRQGPHAEVFLLGINPLINYQRYEKPKLCDLHGYRLYVDTEDAVFNKIKLPPIIRGIVFKHVTDIQKTFFTLLLVADLIGFFCLTDCLLPLEFAPF